MSTFHHGRPSLGAESAPDAPFNAPPPDERENCRYCDADFIQRPDCCGGTEYLNPETGLAVFESSAGWFCNETCELLNELDVTYLLNRLASGQSVKYGDCVTRAPRFEAALARVKGVLKDR